MKHALRSRARAAAADGVDSVAAAAAAAAAAAVVESAIAGNPTNLRLSSYGWGLLPKGGSPLCFYDRLVKRPTRMVRR